ncbi:transcriptional regulator with XRE-family HTH domain [Paraburkholderia sp. RAU6.4a]|uniref:helix-turn-helix domain-containing protein n=1 Tax=Paraburkholderia sp. RAU6.4a TaxID=2991067 RepID=UPI003D1E4690
MKTTDEQMSLRERFARNLKRYRMNLGMTQEELGSFVGADRTGISRLERTFGNPTLERADALATAMKIDVRVLMATAVTAEIEHRPPSGDVSSAAVGAKVLELRNSKGMSQKELGARVGLDRNFISRVESPSGRFTPLEFASLEKLAAALGVSPVDLL